MFYILDVSLVNLSRIKNIYFLLLNEKNSIECKKKIGNNFISYKNPTVVFSSHLTLGSEHLITKISVANIFIMSQILHIINK